MKRHETLCVLTPRARLRFDPDRGSYPEGDDGPPRGADQGVRRGYLNNSRVIYFTPPPLRVDVRCIGTTGWPVSCASDAQPFFHAADRPLRPRKGLPNRESTAAAWEVTMVSQLVHYSEWIIAPLLLLIYAWARFNTPPTNRSGTTCVLFYFGVVFYYALLAALCLLARKLQGRPFFPLSGRSGTRSRAVRAQYSSHSRVRASSHPNSP